MGDTRDDVDLTGTIPGSRAESVTISVDRRTFVFTAVSAVAATRAKVLLPHDMQKGLTTGFLALSDVCPKDQLRLVFCTMAGWFECPRRGDWREGPSWSSISRPVPHCA